MLRTTYAWAVWAMRKWYKGNSRMSERMDELLKRLHEEFGWTTKLLAALTGCYIHLMLEREEKRLAHGWVYEPASICEKNAAAIAMDKESSRHYTMPRYWTPWSVRKLHPVRVSHPVLKEESW